MELGVYHTSGELLHGLGVFKERVINDFDNRGCHFYIKKEYDEYIIAVQINAYVEKSKRVEGFFLVYKDSSIDPFEAVEKFLKNLRNYVGLELKRFGKIEKLKPTDNVKEFLGKLKEVLENRDMHRDDILLKAVERAKERATLKASPKKAIEFAFYLLKNIDRADVAFMFYSYAPSNVLFELTPTAEIFMMEGKHIRYKFWIRDDVIEPVGDFKKFYEEFLKERAVEHAEELLDRAKTVAHEVVNKYPEAKDRLKYKAKETVLDLINTFNLPYSRYRHTQTHGVVSSEKQKLDYVLDFVFYLIIFGVGALFVILLEISGLHIVSPPEEISVEMPLEGKTYYEIPVLKINKNPLVRYEATIPIKILVSKKVGNETKYIPEIKYVPVKIGEKIPLKYDLEGYCGKEYTLYIKACNLIGKCREKTIKFKIMDYPRKRIINKKYINNTAKLSWKRYGEEFFTIAYIVGNITKTEHLKEKSSHDLPKGAEYKIYAHGKDGICRKLIGEGVA